MLEIQKASMENLQNEIIGFMIITIAILLLALLTVKLEKKYKDTDE